MNDYSRMIEDMSSIGVNLSSHQIEQFDKYFNLLVEWNKVMNLTGITEFDEVCKLHFVDSLMAAHYYDFNKEASLIDVGTGAGFPGIPLRIVFPDLQVTLLDSLNKRVKFLDTVIDELGLNNEGSRIITVHGRAEDYANSKSGSLREQFDIGVARAVANMSTLSEYILPYVRVGGDFIAYKSNKAAEEMKDAGNAIKKLGGKLVMQKDTILPSSDIGRSIIFIKKEKSCPKIYPRKAGLPSKQPL
ncbi:16S rRNA (guanine(527)-N(7))-methyltransferase RsmG [Butyrivibrio sp. MC2013]|uniref:16S rRNA (guanine(527)-N(7))-methyltransferase RsmG n=1 Tax=Butyrivibrio sp. MC2013 TaxID=1280686 RepID=UPI0003F4B9E5|nr:16S rRNA (guanine(527)-N(7))-methyltransferase RsmG [Butyrivibrio sp. MC2013]